MTAHNTPLGLTDFTKVLSRLTPAQQALFTQIGRHSEPVTVPMLAKELGLHVSSVRETLEALIKADIVTSERMPTKGRGRPAIGYSTILPPHPMFVALTLKHFSRAVFTWLESLDEDAAMAAAHQIGVNWGIEALNYMNVERLDQYDELPAHFNYAEFLNETRTCLRRMGLGATRESSDPKTLVLLTSPVVEPSNPNRFALQARIGMVDGFLSRRFGRFIDNQIEPDPDNPLNLVLVAHPTAEMDEA
ncbi:molybdenum cofactor biosynthesis protein MoaD [Schaalia vaccimaxillae]|uniref:molybdenum cofactor biosynthesis protein MoaD n=1 Tax=Schaalia vaccimaxillae TaxID=183916 RepID=UPI0003B6AE18|nr:molybdenum cofactor biosynthesis protein MoaD [Schaalia vaccimaxillae]